MTKTASTNRIRATLLSVACFSCAAGLAAFTTNAAASACVEDVPSVTATGEATIELPAETVDIQATYQEQAKSSAAASRALEREFGPLLDDIRADLPVGVDLEAATVRIQPHWNYHDGERDLMYYSATRSLNLAGVPVDAAGEWVQALTESDPNTLNLRNYQADTEGNPHPALHAAVENARDKAATMAGAVGQGIDHALCMTDHQVTRPQPLRAKALGESLQANAAGAQPPEIEPGAVSYNATVEVVFELTGRED